jgi:hypothetical protein
MGGKGRGVEVMREDEQMRQTRRHRRIGTVAVTHWRSVSGLGWASSGFNFAQTSPSVPTHTYSLGDLFHLHIT